MSFSSEVKEELAKQYSKSRHCQLAELAGMLEMEGSYDTVSGQLRMDTDNTLLKEKYIGLLQRAFAIDAEKTLEPDESKKILSALRWDTQKEIPLNEQRADGMLVQQMCCKRAFIRGAFFAAGSISNPNKSYHFEIVCRTMEQAVQLQELVGYFEAEGKIVQRKERYVLQHTGNLQHSIWNTNPAVNKNYRNSCPHRVRPERKRMINQFPMKQQIVDDTILL